MKILRHIDNPAPASNKATHPASRPGPLVWSSLAIAASAVLVRYYSRQAESKHPPAGRFVDVEGIRLHYVEYGEGQPLVLLHGNTTMGTDFELSELVEQAAQSYRVIIFDRPGYGYSDRPAHIAWGPIEQAHLFNQALALMGVERPIVLGHSWGALVAMALGLEFPQSVQGLVLLSGYYYPTARPDIPVAALPAIPGLGDLMCHSISPLLYRSLWPVIMKRMFAPARVPARFKQFPAWMAFRPVQLHASAAEIALLIPATLQLRERYKTLAVPAVIMAGREDRLVHTHVHSGRLHTELPEMDFRVIEGAGHMLHHLAPQAVLDAIHTLAEQSPSG
jgi:pimeloyl-ACP methyl ester carboxylesterase